MGKCKIKYFGHETHYMEFINFVNDNTEKCVAKNIKYRLKQNGEEDKYIAKRLLDQFSEKYKPIFKDKYKIKGI